MAALVYDDSMQRGVQNKHEALLGDLDLLYQCDEKEGAEDMMYSNEATVVNTEERDYNSATDQWPNYSIHAPIEKAFDRLSA